MAYLHLVFGILCIMATSFVAPLYGYGSGAPTDACENLTPQHGLNAQTTQSPYTIAVSKNNIAAGDKISVTITGTNALVFKGFIIQARDATGLPVGSFEKTQNVKLINCGTNGKNNAATHENNSDKLKITVNWTAPRNLKSPVRFWLTVAKTGEVFWVGQTSNAITVNQRKV